MSLSSDGGIVWDKAGLPGPAEHLLQHHAQFFYMGCRAPGLPVKDALEVHVFNILQFQVTNSGLDIVIVLFIVHFQRFSCEPFWLLVELQPLLIPGVDSHGAAYGFLTALCGGQLVR